MQEDVDGKEVAVRGRRGLSEVETYIFSLSETFLEAPYIIDVLSIVDSAKSMVTNCKWKLRENAWPEIQQ